MPEKNFFRQSEDRNLRSALSVSQTSCINGIFVLFIFIRHFCQYIDASMLPYFGGCAFLDKKLGQLIVVPFLFYSGYGVMEQIKKRGETYILAMPRRRILKTWLHFAMAVFLYLLLSMYLQKDYNLNTILLAFTGWESLGNSNWYMFAILIMYICTYISFRLFNKQKALLSCIAFSVAYILIVGYFKDGTWWYNTVICFPVGIIISFYKDQINEFLQNRTLPVLIVCLLVTFTGFHFRSHFISYEIMSIFFVFVIILLCTHLKIENRLFLFLGKYSFEIYILQRLPMIFFKQYLSGYTYMIVCLLLCIGLSLLFKKVEQITDYIFKL